MKTCFKYLAALVLAAAVLSGCLGSRPQNQNTGSPALPRSEASGKTFVLGDTTFNAENQIPDINPHNSYSGWACIRYGVGETLFRYSDSMDPVPWLAESWEQIDARTWRIQLRKNVRFTSGRTMDAQSVLQCLEHLIQVHPQARLDLDIESLKAHGQTLLIQTKDPAPALLNYLSSPYACIFDLQAGISSEGIVQATGPYKALSLVSGQKLELVKNPDYWGEPPKLDRITVLTISDGDTLALALQSGEIDGAYGLSYLSYPLFENENFTFSSCATSRTFFLSMNFDSPIIQDPAVRLAIAMGIDKEGFVNTLLQGHGYAAAGPYPADMLEGSPQPQAPGYDPKAAGEILEQAGWTDQDGDGIREKDGRPLEITWLTYPSRQELPLLAESAQASLAQIGIRTIINSTASHNVVREDRSQWDVYASAMVTAPAGDPEYFFGSCCLEHSSANAGGYYNSQLEELVGRLALAFDQQERSQLAAQMEQILLDDNAFVFCSHLQMSLVSRSYVTGLEAHPCDYYEITSRLDLEQ